MKKYLFLLAQYILPQHGLSRLMGRLTNSTCTRLKNAMIKRFIKKYQVDLSEALVSEPLAYPTFNAFFTRALKPGARPIAGGDKTMVSPADGCLSQVDYLTPGRVIQAKGFDFSTVELLGGYHDLAKPFEKGLMATIYLSPKDYHRVHMPLKGRLLETLYIPGDLFSVNAQTAETVPRLFARNERLVCLFETELGPMAVVLVGAFFVASIVTVWAGHTGQTKDKAVIRQNYTDQALCLEKGGELGHFELGSTVIVLLPQGVARWLPALKLGQAVKMGEALTEAER